MGQIKNIKLHIVTDIKVCLNICPRDLPCSISHGIVQPKLRKQRKRVHLVKKYHMQSSWSVSKRSVVRQVDGPHLLILLHLFHFTYPVLRQIEFLSLSRKSKGHYSLQSQRYVGMRMSWRSTFVHDWVTTRYITQMHLPSM